MRHKLGRATTAIAAAAVAALGGGFLSTFSSPVNPSGGATAAASHDSPCYDSQISTAVQQVSGNQALGYVCNPTLYNNGNWSSSDELRGHVANVLNRCNATSGLSASQSRNLTQAVIQNTGVPPSGAACAHTPYSERYAQTCTSNCDGINWDVYDGSAGYQRISAKEGVYQTLSMCSAMSGTAQTALWITQAVIEETGGLPQRPDITSFASRPGLSGEQIAGQCHSFLYNSGDFYNWEGLKRSISARRTSAVTCDSTDRDIAQAYRDLTGWNPLPHECEPGRYSDFAGNPWDSYGQLKTRIVDSLRCRDPWINRIYTEYFGRAARGHGEAGECNIGLYGNGSWSSFGDLAQKMGVTKEALERHGLAFSGPMGDLSVPDAVGPDLAPHQVLISNPAGVVTDAAGNIIGDKSLGIVSTAGGLARINQNGTPVIAAGGGNVIANGSGNVISLGSGNVISAGAGNVIAAGAGNVIANGGGNVIAAGGGN